MRQRAVEDTARFHLVPIVVFGVDPEDGDCRHAMRVSQRVREFNRRQRFQQGEQRAAEQPRLLPCDDGNGLRIAEARGRGPRFGGCAAPLLLCLKDVGDRVIRSRVRAGSGNRLRPRTRVARIAGEEIRDFRVIERVVGNERPDPRKPSDVDGDA
jgi:hypothetical protein